MQQIITDAVRTMTDRPPRPKRAPSQSRRRFLQAGTLSGAALAVGTALHQPRAVTAGEDDAGAAKLPITIAGYDYDRVAGLIDGRVQVDGCRVKFELSRIGDMNSDVLGGPQTREVTEIGLLPFMLAFANDKFRDYTLIPAFPLRLFRHKSIFIRTDRGIREPADLRGRRVATPGYSSTSLTWIRGILQHEYGVRPDEIDWVVSRRDSSAQASGGASKYERFIPQGVSVTSGPEGKDESDMLVDGDVDALFHAAEPRAYQEGHPQVARLFADSRRTERAYFAKTGIFPIMHAVAVREGSIRENPWLPKAVVNAYSRAKQLAYDEIKRSAWYKTSLPWIAQEADETRRLMGDNYWPYGIEANRRALEALFQFAFEQGLTSRELKIEEIFHGSTLQLDESMT